jgi:hypothetical protein
MKIAATALLASLAAMAAYGQAQAPQFNGKWVAEWLAPNGRPVTASLELNDGTGTWQNRVLARIEDPCPKAAAPLSIVMKDDQPHLFIERSKAIAGCPNFMLKVNGAPVDGVFKATFGDGREVTLKKQ